LGAGFDVAGEGDVQGYVERLRTKPAVDDHLTSEFPSRAASLDRTGAEGGAVGGPFRRLADQSFAVLARWRVKKCWELVISKVGTAACGPGLA
jgi:hypothetical protein